MAIDTVASPALWVAFSVFVALMLALDLGVFNRRAHVVSVKEAAIWSAIWVAISLAFNVFVAVRFGTARGEEFLTGYVIEKSMSIDNLFVFYLVFTAFKVPAAYQHRLLFWGIVGAIVLRAAMVFGGITLLGRFEWIVYVFGAILIIGGLRMFRPKSETEAEAHASTRTHRFISRLLPTSKELDGAKLFTRSEGRLKVTPLFPILVVVELTDVVFAADSILAIFAITRDPFIVLTSNIFAILGMRALYFVLAGMARRFNYLQPGLAAVLIFVGLKLALSEIIHVPILASLAVIALLIGGSIVASIIKNRRAARRAGESDVKARAVPGHEDLFPPG